MPPISVEVLVTLPVLEQFVAWTAGRQEPARPPIRVFRPVMVAPFEQFVIVNTSPLLFAAISPASAPIHR